MAPRRFCSTVASNSIGQFRRDCHRGGRRRFRLYLFLVHTFTADEPFVRPSLSATVNFAPGTLFVAIVGLTYYSSLAYSPYLQTLMNYSVVTAGLVMGPRGIGTMPPCWWLGV